MLSVVVSIDPVPNAGLFSYGLKLNYDGAKARVSTNSDILVPAELDFDGARGPGAQRVVGTNFAAVKGTVNFFAQPFRAYSQARLATFVLAARAPGDFTLSLEIYRTAGTNEDVFIDGAGATLDEVIVFKPATVTIGPGAVPQIRLRRAPGDCPGCFALEYSVCPEADYAVEFRGRLEQSSIWQALPGAPHNSGMVLITNTVPQRFYRIRANARSH